MQVIEKPVSKVQNVRDSVGLTTASDYIRLFTLPCRTSCTFNLSGMISGHDFAIEGSMTCGWNEICITASMASVLAGTKGVYALRGFQTSGGGDTSMYIVFAGDVDGTMTLDTTLTTADVAGTSKIVNLVREGTEPSGKKCSLDFYTGGAYCVQGTTATKI